MGTISMASSKTAWTGSLVWSYSGGVVTVTMYTGKSDGYPSSAASGANFTATITIGSTKKTFTFQQQEISMTVGTASASVSGSSVYIAGRVEAPYGVSMYGYPLTGSQTVSLSSGSSEDVEPSVVSLNTTEQQMGKNVMITIDRDTTDCRHRLTCYFWNHGDPQEITIAENVGTSYAWTVPDLTYLCPNKLSETFWIVCYTYYDGDYLKEYTEARIDLTVPDPTTPSAEGGELILGSANSIACKRNSSNFTVKLSLEFKDTTVDIASGEFDSTSWTPGYDLAKLIPSLTSGTGTLICTTMNGTAEVGTQTATIKVIVPENDVTRPKFTAGDLTLSPVSSLPEAFEGLYMRGKTGLTAEFAASSEYSTISEYSVIIGNQSATGNPATIDLLVNEGEVKVIGKVTDARGFSTSVTTTVTVLPYRNPKVTPYTGYSDVICERARDTGELSPNGTYLAIKAGRSFSSVVLDGEEKNSCVLRYRWKPNGAEAYSDWITLLEDGSAETEVSLLVGNVVSSLQKSYLVQICAADALEGAHTLTFQIMTEAISFVLYDGPDGAGFGKYPEAPHVVDIASHMTLLVRGRLRVMGDDWVSTGLAAGISESAYEYGRKETGCHYLVTEGRHVHIAFNCAFAYAGVPVIINDDPIPEEHRPLRTVTGFCPANDRQLICVSVDPDGYIRVEWVQKATDTLLTGTADVTWADGYLCYWT